MDNNMSARIDEILANVNSIDDLDLNIISKLRGTLIGRFSLDKFEVTPDDWKEWVDKFHNLQGVEYDAQNSRIRIKATGSPLHRTATGVIGEWLQGVRDHLNKYPGHDFDCMRSSGVILSSEYEGSEKIPDEGLRQIGELYPLIAVEIAVSENPVFEDATRWLKGSGGRTKLVIIVDVKEKISQNSAGEAADWGLSKDVINTLDLADLTKHILQWHKNNKSSLVGHFESSLYLCFQNQQPKEIWKCEFSLDDPKPRCFTFEEMNDITTELNLFSHFPLPLQTLSTKMRKSLIDHELQRASRSAWEKLKEIRENAQSRGQQ